jgi:hypothetical protein
MAEVFALDRHNNYIPTMSREEIIAAIQTAANGGNLEGFENCAFVSQVKEINRNAAFSVWVGTQAEYNAIAEPAKNVLYLISDDPMCNELPTAVAGIKETTREIERLLVKHDSSISEQSKTTAEQEKTIAAQGETLKNHAEQLTEQAKKIEENNEKIDSLTNIGYTTLFSGDESGYTAVNGITISSNWDLYDFLIFEFREHASDSEKWFSRAMLPTAELNNNTKYGLILGFGATDGRCCVLVDTQNKNKLFFNRPYGSDMSLVKIFGYLKKKEV